MSWFFKKQQQISDFFVDFFSTYDNMISTYSIRLAKMQQKFYQDFSGPE